tara:strand:- start:95745 stop:96635 length:891 start_codon:yes stop_codon:yes gene_type:complete
MSSMNHSRSVVDSMVSDLRKARKPHINIVDIARTSNEGFARVTASVTHTSASRQDHSQVLSALSEKLGAKVRPIEGSFHAVAGNSVGDTISGIVTSNPEVVAYDENIAEGFKAIAGNMFMDDEEQLWALRKTEAGDLLVKSRGKEDADIISDLMTSLSSADVGTMAFEAQASAQRDEGIRCGLQGGDFITFVNPETEDVQFGAVVASVCDDTGRETGNVVVQSVEASSKPVMIDRQMTLGKFDDVDFDDTGLVDDNVAEASAHTLDFIASYYQRLFQRDPSYYEKFMERWMAHTFG